MPSILDRKFEYTPAASTDIRRTFRKHGWIGPEEKRLGKWVGPGIVVHELPASPPAPTPPVVHPLQNALSPNVYWSAYYGPPLGNALFY